MSRTTITRTGAICYRTKPMPLSLASSFALMLQGNAERFCEVAITQSQRTKAESYFVQFRPVNPQRQGDLYEREFNARKERGETEGLDYIFWADPDNPAVTWCFNPASGETYQLGLCSCSCPDYQIRCERAGLLCKHLHSRSAQAERRAEIERAARHERCLRNRNRDF